MEEGAWSEEAVQALLINPFSAVTAAPIFCEPHEPIVERRTWIQANVRLIEQMGAEAWLERLLEVLEHGGPTAATDPPEARRSGKQYRLRER
jgi:hypothetical protein